MEEEEAGRPGGLGRGAAPGAAQPGDQQEGDAPRTLEIKRSFHEAPGTGASRQLQPLRGCPRPSLRVPGVGAILPRWDRRAEGPAGELLCAAPRPGWQRWSGADSFNEARRFSVSTKWFLCF